MAEIIEFRRAWGDRQSCRQGATGGRPPAKETAPPLPLAVRVDFRQDRDTDTGEPVLDVAICAIVGASLLDRLRHEDGRPIAKLPLRDAALWLKTNGYSYARGTPGVWLREGVDEAWQLDAVNKVWVHAGEALA